MMIDFPVTGLCLNDYLENRELPNHCLVNDKHSKYHLLINGFPKEDYT